MRYEDLPPDTKELIDNAYYDGLVNDTLHTFLIDNEELLVIPDICIEMTGKEVVEALEHFDYLEDFEQYLDEEEISLTKEDYCENHVLEFNKTAYSLIRERYVENFMETEYDKITEKFFRR